MASITLTGTLLDPTGEVAVGDQIRFTHRTTTGDTIQFARSVLIIPPNGAYDIDLEFGNIFIEYLDIKDVSYKNLGVVTVNIDSTATSLPELLNAIDPPTDEQLLEFQSILADTVTAKDLAEAAAASVQIKTFETLAILVANETTQENDIIHLEEHTAGFGGGGTWKAVLLTSVTPSPGEPLIGGIVVSDGVPTLAFVLLFKDSIVNVASMGALEDDGVTDNTAAFLLATSIGLSVFVPRISPTGFYKGSIVSNDDQTTFCYGAEIRAGASNVAFTHGDRSVLDGLNIKGAGKTVGPTQVGVSALGKLETKTQNLTISAINGDAYQRSEGVDRHQGNHLSNFIIKDSINGINEGTRAEYNKTVGGSIFGNDIGIRIKGGNNNYAATTVTDNLIGVELVNGANDAHGVCSGLTINHNTTANILTGVLQAKSFNFSACEIFAGDIHMIGSEGVTFKGCDISTGVEIKEEGAIFCHFIGCNFISGVTISPNFNGAPSEVYYWPSNVWNDTLLTTPVIFREGSRTTATLETNTLGIATGTTTNILDTTSSNAISGNPNYAFQFLFLDGVGDKHFDFSRKTRYNGELIRFNASVGVSRSGSYLAADDVTVRLQGSVLGTVLTATLQRQSDDGSRFINVYSIQGFVRRDNTDKYQLELVNNSGGDVDVFRNQSDDTIVFCEAWGW